MNYPKSHRRPSPIRRPSPLRKAIRPKATNPPQRLTPLDVGAGERLQKVLAGAGLGSRRHMEQLIAAGRVLVNGQAATIGQRVHATDALLLDGRPIAIQSHEPDARVLLYHKPAGEIVSRDDPQGRPNVFDNLPKLDTGRWISVGRLDFNTSGLLLLTTSGDLANALMHPSSRIEREYAVRIRALLSENQIASLTKGIELEDGLGKIERIEARGGGASNRWYHVVLFEGRNREVRRLFDAIGQPVGRLLRVRFGSLVLPPRLRPGHFLELSPSQIQNLKGLPA
ncbi:MAG: pseudouridine synthase [Burkholderiales bacterium]